MDERQDVTWEQFEAWLKKHKAYSRYKDRAKNSDALNILSPMLWISGAFLWDNDYGEKYWSNLDKKWEVLLLSRGYKFCE